MSKYTTEERFICEEKAGYDESVGFNDVDEVLDKSWDKIFTTKCEIFDEDYRAPLCKKILKHFYTREIGAETVGLWQLWMNRTLEEQLPFFNQLYQSALLKFPIFDNFRNKTTHEKENTGETTSNTDEKQNSNSETDMNGKRRVDTHEVGTETGTSDTQTTDKYNEDGTKDFTQNETENEHEVGESHTQTSDTMTDTIDTGKQGDEEIESSVKISQTEEGSKDVNGTEGLLENTAYTTYNTENKNNTETTNKTEQTVNSHNDTTTTNATKQSSNDHWDMYSDTPQGGLQNVKGDPDSNVQYLTNVRNTTDSDTEELNQTVDNQGGFTETKGNQGGTVQNTGTNTDLKDEKTVHDYTKTNSEHTDTEDELSRKEDTTTDKNWSETDNTEEHQSKNGTSDTDTEKTTDTTKDTTYDEKNHTESTDDGTSDTQTTRNTETTGSEDTTYSQVQTTTADKATVYEALGTSHDLENYVEKVCGKQGSETYAEMLLHFRDTFLNIDMQLIDKFEENFMQLW